MKVSRAGGWPPATWAVGVEVGRNIEASRENRNAGTTGGEMKLGQIGRVGLIQVHYGIR